MRVIQYESIARKSPKFTCVGNRTEKHRARELCSILHDHLINEQKVLTQNITLQ